MTDWITNNLVDCPIDKPINYIKQTDQVTDFTSDEQSFIDKW